MHRDSISCTCKLIPTEPFSDCCCRVGKVMKISCLVTILRSCTVELFSWHQHCCVALGLSQSQKPVGWLSWLILTHSLVLMLKCWDWEFTLAGNQLTKQTVLWINILMTYRVWDASNQILNWGLCWSSEQQHNRKEHWHNTFMHKDSRQNNEEPQARRRKWVTCSAIATPAR